MSIESVMLSNHLILCHPLILLPSTFPASGSFPISWLFASGGQSIGASSFQRQSFQWLFRVNIDCFDWLQDWLFRSTGCPGNSQESSPAPQFESINSSALSIYGPTLTSILDDWKRKALTFVGKVMSLLFNMLSRFVLAFLPRSKHLLISWLHSLSTVILEPKKIKSITAFTFSPSICHEVMRLDAMILVFFNAEFIYLFIYFYF